MLWRIIIYISAPIFGLALIALCIFPNDFSERKTFFEKKHQAYCNKHEQFFDNLSFTFKMVIAISGTVLGMTVLVLIVGPIDAYCETSNFLKEKAYVEQSTDVSEEISEEKESLNHWLFDSQWEQSHYPNVSFYSESIQDLKPIE